MNLQSTELRPVSEADRLFNVDVLRGAALLGILLINISFFALPQNFDEAWRANSSNANFWVLAGITVLFEGKMRALFSMVFGVSILLFISKKEKSREVTVLYYKRMGWLILFGLIDSNILLWVGDILFVYGVCGLVAYLFRNVRPLYLAMGVPLVTIISFIMGTILFQGMRDKLLAYREIEPLQTQEVVLTEQQQKVIADWREVEKDFFPNPDDVANQTLLMKGSYKEVASFIRPLAFDFQISYLLVIIWDPLALMLLGMALYKWGFLSGKWSKKHYWITAVIGYGIGLSLVIYSYWYGVINFSNTEARLNHLADHPIHWVGLIYNFQRILLVLAHVSVILLLIKNNALTALMNRLAAVGRMAFTNYVMQTLICTGVFFGYGLNYFAELEYYQLFYVVLGIWLFQLWVSPLWLKYYRFGPLEWVWRSLSYWKRQPMKGA